MQQRKLSHSKHPLRALLFVTNPTMMLLVLLFALFTWHIPSRVRIELVVEYQGEVGIFPEADALLQGIQEQTLMITEGHIQYPEFPDITPVKFVFPERIELQAETLHVESVSFLSSYELLVQLDGVATHLTTGTPEASHDRRLTQFDNVKASPRLVWLGISLWFIATVLGWLRAYQALNA